MPSTPILCLSKVTKSYEALTGAAPVVVLKEVSFALARGETVAIVGPSGSGKSTLLNIIGTLDRPTSGQVTLGDQNLASLDEQQLATVRNRQIGFIFQSHHLLPQCSVLENVLVPTLAGSRRPEAAEGAGVPKSEPHLVTSVATENPDTRATRLLKRVGLGERLHHRPGQLSGGERQRVAVVRALINRPQLLLADEPTGALDRASAQQLAGLLLDLNREEGVTLIVVTHALDLAHKMGRVIELKDGRLAEDGG